MESTVKHSDSTSSERGEELKGAVSDDGSTQHSSSFAILESAIDKSVKKMCARARVFGYIKEHFRPVYKTDSENVVSRFKSIMTQLEDFVKEDIGEQLKANNVESRLERLDKIKETQKPGPTWRPSGNADFDVQAHLQDVSQYEVEYLEQILSALEEENKYLNTCVAESDKEITTSVNEIEAACLKWEKASNVLSEDVTNELIDLQVSLN